jgi:hypothetical protein
MCGPFFVLPPLHGEGGREATGWGSVKPGAGGAGLACPTRARLRLAVPPHFGGGRSVRARLFAACFRGGSGEGAGRPGLARCCCVVTVSTKQTAPRGRFPRAIRLAALVSGLAGSPPQPLPAATRGGHDGLAPAVRSRGARRANGGHPSTSLRTPGLSSARASSLDHSPPNIGALDPTPSPPTGWAGVWHASRRGWFVTLENLKSALSQGVVGAGYADNRRIVSRLMESAPAVRCAAAPVSRASGRQVGHASRRLSVGRGRATPRPRG